MYSVMEYTLIVKARVTQANTSHMFSSASIIIRVRMSIAI